MHIVGREACGCRETLYILVKYKLNASENDKI
jgi:hypothetical protein